MSSSSVIKPEDVLEHLMNDGTIDALRLRIINQLKANEELKSTTIKMAEESKVLNTPGAEKQTKRELFDALRQELEGPVLEKASKSVWDLIIEKDGLGKEINETVERVFCHLSGQEPPFYSSSNVEKTPMEIDKETEVNDSSKTKPKKRSLSEVNSSEGIDEVATTKKKQGDSSTVTLESRKTP
ncbi:hypothetical protein AtNW77_Chr1g0056771 [Arabidopsis thaliana]|uniref:Uncharacterized protein n=2 Tax=Arabidopsis TaxID=3701 RepID=A0A178W4Q2_ARATH|nr:hypothetical protein ISN45_At01g048530 [Arabidopsis thaliana x Arabidopsis arenosa]OAP13480.1 hypothetical protein AXX17_AT1G51120 [Arabidopsis thaliana]